MVERAGSALRTGLKKPPRRIGVVTRIAAVTAAAAFTILALTLAAEGDWLSAAAFVGLASATGISAFKGIDRVDSSKVIERHACPCCDCLTLQYDNDAEAWVGSVCPVCDWVADPGAEGEHLGYTLQQARDHFQRYYRFYTSEDAAKWGAGPATPEEVEAKSNCIRASRLLVACHDAADARDAWRALETCERELRALMDLSLRCNPRVTRVTHPL